MPLQFVCQIRTNAANRFEMTVARYYMKKGLAPPTDLHRAKKQPASAKRKEPRPAHLAAPAPKDRKSLSRERLKPRFEKSSEENKPGPNTLPVRIPRPRSKSRSALLRLSNEKLVQRKKFQSPLKAKPKQRKAKGKKKIDLNGTQRSGLSKQLKKRREESSGKCNSGRRPEPKQREPSEGERLVKELCEEQDLSSKCSWRKERQEFEPCRLSAEAEETVEVKDMVSDEERDEQLVRMAIKIQSCWRAYKVRRMLEEYGVFIARNSQGEPPDDLTVYSEEEKEIDEPIMDFEEFSPPRKGGDEEQSPLPPREEGSRSVKEALRKVKQQQLDKWNGMIELIESEKKKGSSANTQRLLQRLAEQSEANKKEIESFSFGWEKQDLIKELDSQRYREMLDGERVSNLLHARELVLRQRQREELEKARLDLSLGRIDDSRYRARVQAIEDWAEREGQEVAQAKIEISYGLEKAKQAVLKTKRDILCHKRLGGQFELLPKCYSEERLPRAERTMTLFVRQPSIQSIRKLQEIKTSSEAKRRMKSEEEEGESRPCLTRTSNLPREESEESAEEEDNAIVVLSEDDRQKFRKSLLAHSNAIIETLYHEEMFIFAEEMIDVGLAASLRVHFGSLLPPAPPEQVSEHQPASGRRGIRTNIDSVEDYLASVTGLMEASWQSYLARLQVPIPPEPLQMLSYLRIIEEDEPEPEFDHDQDNANELILHQDLLEEIEGRLANSVESNLSGYLQVHNRAIFDAFNESLDHERPFGLLGRPFPWKAKARFERKFTRGDYLAMVESGKERVLEWCEAGCGFLAENHGAYGPLSEEQVRLIREHKLSRLLGTQLFEGEEKWVQFDDEQTEIMMDLCHQVIKQVFLEEATTLLR